MLNGTLKSAQSLTQVGSLTKSGNSKEPMYSVTTQPSRQKHDTGIAINLFLCLGTRYLSECTVQLPHKQSKTAINDCGSHMLNLQNSMIYHFL